MRIVLRSVFLLSSLIFINGCVSLNKPSTEDFQQAVTFGHTQLTCAPQRITCATFSLFASEVPLDENYFKLSQNSFHVDLPKNLLITRGQAFAVDHRGYLLTAEHCLGKHLYLLGLVQHRIRLLHPSVVIKLRQEMGCDYALLHVDEPLDEALTQDAQPGIGDPILGLQVRDQRYNIMGGIITAIRRIPDLPQLTIIESTLPLWRGDSGGALVSPDGRLIGVSNTIKWEARFMDVKYTAISCALDSDYLRKIIEEDYRERKSLAAPR